MQQVLFHIARLLLVSSAECFSLLKNEQWRVLKV